MDPAHCPLCVEFDREHGARVRGLIAEDELAQGESVRSVYAEYLRGRHRRGHKDL